MHYQGDKQIHIDNLDFLWFWIRDENCHKTLGEILPLYQKHRKKKDAEIQKIRQNIKKIAGV